MANTPTYDNQFPKNIDDTLPGQMTQYRLQKLVSQIYQTLYRFLPGTAVQVGTIITYTGSNVPSGYLQITSSQTYVSTTTYANLYAVIGTTWGSGSGTFSLPYIGSTPGPNNVQTGSGIHFAIKY